MAQESARGSSALKALLRTLRDSRDAPGSRAQCWALTPPRAVYRELLPSRVWAEHPTGVKAREAAVLLLLRDTSDHKSQRKRGPAIAVNLSALGLEH